MASPDVTQTQGTEWDGDARELDGEQSIEERRRIQRKIRGLIKQTTTDQTRFLDAKAEALHVVLDESDNLLRATKQTTEAAIDAALVIRVSELAYKRTTHFLADRTDDTGIRLEDFIARAKDYMRFGRGIEDDRSPDLTRAQRKRRRVGHRGEEGERNQVSDAEDGDDDDEEEEAPGGRDEPLDWGHLGRYACLPRLRRPGLARFLPRTALLADDKTRVMRKRTAALRLNDLQEVRPQVLRPGDLATSQNSDLTALATDILQQLRRTAERGQQAVQTAYEAADTEDAALLQQLMDRHGLRSDGGVDLIRFAVNPRSFAQTIENFFYISFLVRDGRAGLAYDDNGLPSIYPISDEDAETAREGNAREEDTRKHQLILSMDMATWRDIIDTFHIQEPMIAHRDTAREQHPNGRAWFT